MVRGIIPQAIYGWVTRDKIGENGRSTYGLWDDPPSHIWHGLCIFVNCQTTYDSEDHPLSHIWLNGYPPRKYWPYKWDVLLIKAFSDCSSYWSGIKGRSYQKQKRLYGNWHRTSGCSFFRTSGSYLGTRRWLSAWNFRCLLLIPAVYLTLFYRILDPR